MEEDRPYVATFEGVICVAADSPTHAAARAVEWAMTNLSESASVPSAPTPVHPCADASMIPVPLIGTMNFIGPSQEAVNDKVRDKIESARRRDSVQGIEMGPFVVSGGTSHMDEGVETA